MAKQRWLAVVAGVYAWFSGTPAALAHEEEQGAPVCEPREDGLRCTQGDCDDPDSKCRPAVVRCDADGKCLVVKCDCQGRRCHIRMGEDGRPKCGGKCEDGSDCQEIRETSDTGETTISCSCVKRECEPRADGRHCKRAHCASDDEKCRPTVVECDADGKCVVAECDCQTKGGCTVRLDDKGQPRCGGRCEEGNDCKEKREEMDGGGVRVTCECSQRVCEPRADGQRCRKAPCASDQERCQPTLVSCDPEGRCRVVECDCQHRKGCRVRLPKEGTDGEPVCVGGCANGEPCTPTREELATGETLYGCKCDPQAKECEPDDGGRACNGAECADESQRCRATVVVCDASGDCRVETCDCADRNQCGVELNDNGRASCRGNCPIGGACQLQETTLEDGGVMIECGCAFANCGKPDSSGLRCSNLICSEAGHRCTPTTVECNASGSCRVLECDCRDPSECHVRIDPSSRRASCDGGCPDNLRCVESRTTLPNGGEEVNCDCEEP